MSRKGIVLAEGVDTESLAFSSDGRYLAASHPFNSLEVWDTEHRTRVWSRPHEGQLWPIVYLPDGHLLANWLGRGVTILDGKNGEERHCFPWEDVHGIPSFGLSPDGTACALADESGATRLLHIPWGRVEPIQQLRGVPFHPVFDRAGRWIAFSLQLRPLICVYSREQNRFVLERADGAEGRGWQIDFLSDGRLVAAGGAARDRIRVFAADFSDVRELPTEIAIDRLAAHPDGNYFLSWGDDSVVRLWDASTGDQTVLVETGGSNANVVAIAASGRWLAAGRYDSVLELWDLG